MKKNYFLLFLVFISLVFQSFGQKQITLEDIWAKGTFRPDYLYGLNWMKNSGYYTALDYDFRAQTAQVVKYDINSGKPVQVLVKGEQLKDPDTGAPIEIEDYTLNPDESAILIASEIESIYRRSFRAFYYLYDLPSRKIVKVSENKIMHPSFSPDGKNLAYVHGNNLFNLSLKTGKLTQITKDGEKNKIINGSSDWVYEEEFEFSKAFFWAPDGNKLAFYKFDETEVKEYNLQLWNGLYPEDYRYKYPKAGEKNSLVSIHVYDLQTGKTAQMNTGLEKDQYIPRVKWTSNSSLLSIQRLNRLQNHFELLHANAVTGDSRVVYEEKNNTYIEIRNDLTYLKDNKHFILTSEKDGFRHIYLFDMNGKEIFQLTKGEWEVLDFSGVDEQNRLVYFSSTEVSPLQKHFYSVSLEGKNKKQLSEKDGYHEVEISPDFKYSLDYFSAVSTPYRISVNKLPSGKSVREIVDNEQLKEKLETYNIQKPEFFKFTGTHGTELNAYIIKPAGFDPSKKYPVLVTVYGGPGHQTVLDQWGGSNYLWYQMLAQKGYLVVAVDNRGTGGRGADFKKITQNQLGKLEAEDMIETARYLGTLDFINKDRIGIFGWSFGGYLSSLAMTLGADFFKMGIAVAPVTSWRFYDTIYTERFLGLPEENPEGYDLYSPLTHAGKLKGNYLLVHGTADDNVHLQNAMAMQEALNTAGKKYDVFYYPNKNHGIYGGNTRLHLYNMLTEYIMKNL